MTTFTHEEIALIKEALIHEDESNTKPGVYDCFVGFSVASRLRNAGHNELSIRWHAWFNATDRASFDQAVTMLTHKLAGDPDSWFTPEETVIIAECIREEIAKPNGYYNAGPGDFIAGRIRERGHSVLAENWRTWQRARAFKKEEFKSRGVEPIIVELMAQTGKLADVPDMTTFGT